MDRKVLMSEEEVAMALTTASDVVKIIEACCKSGVRCLKFNGLDVEFGPYMPAIASHGVADMSKKQLDSIMRQREVQLREEQLSEMMIADPAAYESAILDGDIKPSNEEDQGIQDE